MRSLALLLMVLGISGCGAARHSVGYGRADANAILPDDGRAPTDDELVRFDSAMANAENELGMPADGEYRAAEGAAEESDHRNTRTEPEATGAPATSSTEVRPPMSATPEQSAPTVASSEHEPARDQESSERQSQAREDSCSRPCRLVALVCELSVRMCRISSANPAEEALSQRCSRGRLRCDGARDHVRSCDCS